MGGTQSLEKHPDSKRSLSLSKSINSLFCLTMPRPKKQAKEAPANEHIFPASQLTPLAIKWKELTKAGRHKEAAAVLEKIIVESTAMFERSAQYEDFHYTVDLPVLVSAAQEKVVKWLAKWNHKKGSLFTWFSKCSKNAFRSELVKVNQYRKKYHVTGDNLEKFYGIEDHAIDKHDIAEEYKKRLHQMTCRWGDPQIIGAIRYIVDCITEDDHDKAGTIKGASYAWGISYDMSKFFYGWSTSALRHELHDKVYLPFTEEDLVRAACTYEDFIDILDHMPFKEAMKLLARWQGRRIKFPSISYLTKIHQNYALFKEIDKSDLDPDSVAMVARNFKRTPRAAQDIYTEMVEILDPRRTGEHYIYGDEHDY
jgi:hypothetical protein